MTRLAMFDMDRTLLEVETASLYVRYQRQIGEATLVDLLRTLGWVAQYTFGTGGRTDTRTRTPHRNNWDFVATKELQFPGTVRGQLRFEVLNITNTVKVRGPETRLGNAAFGNIGNQSGFMRLTQLMFRLSF